MALLYASLVDEGEVSFDDLIGDLIECHTFVGSHTVRDYFHHRLQFYVEDGLGAILVDRRSHRERLLASPVQLLPEPRYSEYTGWQLLGLAAASVTGQPLDELITTRVLEPLGIEDIHTRHWRDMKSDRGRVNGGIRAPFSFTPLLAERGGWLEWRENPGSGGYMSMLACVRLFGEMLRCLAGNGRILRNTVEEMVEPGALHYDEIVNRNCRFGHGMFVDMQHFDLPLIVSPRSFGQIGLMGMSGVVADPEQMTVAAYHLAGFTDTATMNNWLRPAIMGRLFSGSTPG